MLINRTITKKLLETIVHETFSQFGLIASSCLLDSLKLLGFYYATNAGISINIEDLKTPNVKKKFIKTANQEIDHISKLWQQGFVSDSERFQTIIDSWNIATESLKNRIVDYYQTFDPANNLYIMAFSGARGNMSQVRQLVGMRGLMSDQEGKIIDLPIQANFREGLSSIDYIISSYGARKGIVDTALKTADSGYLTRRLIYLAQDLVIRQENCNTKEGIIVLLKKNTNVKNLIGRVLTNTQPSIEKNRVNFVNNTILTTIVLKDLKLTAPISLNIRSALMCKSNGSICQNCYGWDLAHNKLISLGETVGIIAAQSIGEPGTQLTMRTFHTGGIFTSEILKQIRSPFSGKIHIPPFLNTISYRTTHGTVVLKLQQEVVLLITNWKGIQKELFLEIGSYLYITKSSFVKKDQVIAEYSTQSLIPTKRRLKPIYTSFAGEIRFENLLVRKIFKEKDKRTIKINQDDGVLWIAAGQIFALPKEVSYIFSKELKNTRPLARLKLISNYEGLVYEKNSSLFILNNQLKITIHLENLIKVIKKCRVEFVSIIKNYQYIDKYTVLGYLEIFPNLTGSIYSIRKKETKYINIYFLITESDVWKINCDQINNFDFFQDKKTVVRSGNLINSTSKFSNSGFFLKKDGFKMIFQNATPIFLTRGTILNYKQGDFVLEKKVFATLLSYSQQTEDIVQGLPKIEELIEARRPKTKASLALRPGIILNSSGKNEFQVKRIETLKRRIFENTFSFSYKSNDYINSLVNSEKKKKEKKVKKEKKKKEIKLLNISHSLFLKEDVVVYNNMIFRVHFIPSVFQLYQKSKTKKDDFVFKFKVYEKSKKTNDEFTGKLIQDDTLLFYGKIPPSTWSKEKLQSNVEKISSNNLLFKYSYGKLVKWKELSNFQLEQSNGKADSSNNVLFLKNKKDDYIVKTIENKFLFLEYLNPIKQYGLSLTSTILLQPGNFVDIGEPLTEGIIDAHELLSVLFNYHIILDGIFLGTFRSVNKFQLLLVNSIQSIYQSQGVSISSKHIEIIVKQMTAKVIIKESGDTPLLPGELLRISLMNEIYNGLKKASNNVNYKVPKYEPILLSATNSSLNKDGFLSSAGFQETKRVLTKAAIEGSSDWLRGLKECIIIGRLIPAGSSFLNYKRYLDNIYLFKDL